MASTADEGAEPTLESIKVALNTRSLNQNEQWWLVAEAERLKGVIVRALVAYPNKEAMCDVLERAHLGPAPAEVPSGISVMDAVIATMSDPNVPDGIKSLIVDKVCEAIEAPAVVPNA